MKRLVFLFVMTLCCSSLNSQTPEQMKAWEDNMTPGAHHQWLASMDGNWDATVTMWMDPSQPPSVSKATTTNEMIMNGLYQRSTHKGEMMGMPFHGESLLGFDNYKKKFVGTWIDNMGSGIMTMEGDYDAGNNAVTLKGSMMDPASGQMMNVKQVITYNSPDSNTFVMYMMDDGQEVKTMEIEYTRVK